MPDLDLLESMRGLLPAAAAVEIWGTAVGLVCVAAAWVSCRRALRERGRRDVIARAQAAAQECAGCGLIVVDGSGLVLEVNAIARQLLGSEQTSGETVLLPEPIRLLLSDQDSQHHTLRFQTNKLIDLAISAPVEEFGTRGILLRDVTEDRRGRDHLLKLAHYDSLTGLGNRRLFIDRLDVAMRRARDQGTLVALLYIDIDRFKEVNDSFGHAAGDELLKAVARRFRSQMQTWRSGSKRKDSFVARLSGDEFAIVALGFADQVEIQDLAQHVVDSIVQPVSFEGRTIPSSASMGVSIFPDHGSDVEDLFKSADAALYVAKESGRGRCTVFDPSFTAHAEHSRKIEMGLRQAIARSELRLHYQPKIEARTGTTAGFEALLRWRNEEIGLVSPKDFIPVAEERGLIREIGAWCIDEACRQIRAWRDAGFDTVPISVNVSSAQFVNSDLQNIVTNALVRHAVEPSSFEIELTESLILDDNDTTALALRDLRAIGVRVALDDFGTGYSALTYLNRFPLDTVKMDRGFLRGIEHDKAVAGIAAAVISMSHSLGFEVVAEGVDCERQAEILWSMGCDQIQGFLFAPAVPALEASRFLARRGADRPRVPTSPSAGKVDQILAIDEASEFEPFGPVPKPTDRARDPLSSERQTETRTLVLDDERGSLSQLTVRMMRLGADVHLVQGIDEACVFVDQDEPTLDLMVVPISTNLPRLADLRERIEKAADGSRLQILVVGDAVEVELRTELRQARIDWLVTGPIEDVDLRFFIAAARHDGGRSNHQRAARVPIESTAWIRASGERRVGTLTSLSRRGAFVETNDGYRVGQSIHLEFKADNTRIRAFANVAYCHDGEQEIAPYSSAGIGVVFYDTDEETTSQVDGVIEQIWSRHLP